RGVEVHYSAKAINKAYFNDDNADATEYLANLENPNDHYTWVASLIAAVDELVVDTPTSSFATPVAPQPDQFIFIARMDLEHRVSELKGIGAREALAALKADMRKVMTDVQQLQPDLSIFD
ncbi:hypothetical protein HAX54_005476, partial [Datura stramonium]|nr:hypothetical protein [Datura stramonium]